MKNKHGITALQPIEQLLLWGTLAVLAFYSHGFLFNTPYAGFNFEISTGEITRMYLPSSPDRPLIEGDRLLQVGDVEMEDFEVDLTLPLFAGVHAGDAVPMDIRRAGENLTIAYIYPGFTTLEFLERLPSQWWLAFAFWAWGLVVLVGVRPRDQRWRLLVAFNFVMAVFWAAGNGSSHWHYGYSPYLVRGLIWLVPAVYFHLNWVFPYPLRDLSPWFWRGWYVLTGALALGGMFDLLPGSLSLLALLVGLLGSALLLMAHVRRAGEEEKAASRLLMYVSFLAVLPAIVAGLGYAFGGLPGNAFAGGLLAVPLLPGVYVYVLSRARLGGLELRASRAITQITYLVLSGAAAVGLAAFFGPGGGNPLWAIGFGFLGTLTAIYAYPYYERAFQKRVLGMTAQPEELERRLTAHISTSLDQPTLLDILQRELLPTLLIRQWALLRQNSQGGWEMLADRDLPAEPTPGDLAALQSELGVFRGGAADVLPWVRLALPLRTAGQQTGLWLLGRRDPDDYYNPLEYSFFQHLADQIALALVNIDQASQLRALYQGNIDNHERERERLARELHDDILNHLAILLPAVDDPKMLAELESLVASLRQTVTGLRPAMLTYGLQPALDELVDILEDRPGMQAAIDFDIPPTEVRFDPAIELHFFRIMQQACENALRHGQPTRLSLYGEIQPQRVELHVADDGRGFVPHEHSNVVELMHNGHFGMAGMLERADLLGAALKIRSAPGQGTTISIMWKPK